MIIILCDGRWFVLNAVSIVATIPIAREWFCGVCVCVWSSATVHFARHTGLHVSERSRALACKSASQIGIQWPKIVEPFQTKRKCIVEHNELICRLSFNTYAVHAHKHIFISFCHFRPKWKRARTRHEMIGRLWNERAARACYLLSKRIGTHHHTSHSWNDYVLFHFIWFFSPNKCVAACTWMVTRCSAWTSRQKSVCVCVCVCLCIVGFFYFSSRILFHSMNWIPTAWIIPIRSESGDGDGKRATMTTRHHSFAFPLSYVGYFVLLSKIRVSDASALLYSQFTQYHTLAWVCAYARANTHRTQTKARWHASGVAYIHTHTHMHAASTFINNSKVSIERRTLTEREITAKSCVPLKEKEITRKKKKEEKKKLIDKL